MDNTVFTFVMPKATMCPWVSLWNIICYQIAFLGTHHINKMNVTFKYEM